MTRDPSDRTRAVVALLMIRQAMIEIRALPVEVIREATIALFGEDLYPPDLPEQNP